MPITTVKAIMAIPIPMKFDGRGILYFYAHLYPRESYSCLVSSLCTIECDIDVLLLWVSNNINDTIVLATLCVFFFINS